MIKKNSGNITVSGVIMRRLLLIAVILIFLGTGTACDNLQTGRNNLDPDGEGDNFPYVYTDPELDIELDRELNFKVGYKPSFPYTDAIEVFCEPSLRYSALDAEIDYKRGKFIIKPKNKELTAKLISGPEYFTNHGKWGLSDEYFVVQKLDPKSGKPLEKPLVTRFTVKNKIDKPVVSFFVDDEGAGNFSWEPVENATRYFIVKMRDGYPVMDIIGSTTETQWTTTEQDRTNQGDNEIQFYIFQNSDFKSFNYSDDEIDSFDAEPEEQKFKKNTYGFIASDEIEISALYLIDGSSIEKRLPYEVAMSAMEEMKVHPRDVKKFDDIPSQIPIIMTDGTTVLRPVVIDVDGTKIGDTIYVDTKACIIPYKVEGTRIKSYFTIFEYKSETYKSEVQRIAAQNEQAVNKTGELLVYTYRTEKTDLSNVEISRTEPDVPYSINATNPYTKYIAANMIAGNKYIDVRKHVNDRNGISVYDAAAEAGAQNPYILGVKKLNYIKDQKVLEVEYLVSSDEERTRLQKAVHDEVSSIIGSIISEGMTDEQKVKAINDYIIKTAEYDYKALKAKKADGESFDINKYRDSWNLAGILINKTAVCEGYAKAFKALADKAGLEAVYVNGLTEAENHAWNKVKVNGAWRLIDVTWNDSKSKPNEYYLITDEEAGEKRFQFQLSHFVIDVLIGNYATN